MKRLLPIILCVIFAALSIVSCEKGPVTSSLEKLDRTIWSNSWTEKSGSLLIFGTEKYNFCFEVSRTDADGETFRAGIFAYKNPKVSMTLAQPGKKLVPKTVSGKISQDGKNLTLSDGPVYVYSPGLNLNKSDRKELKSTYWVCDDNNSLTIDEKGIIEFVEDGETYPGGSFYINPFAGLVVDCPGRITEFRAGRVSRDGSTLKLSNGLTYTFTSLQ